ncbi:MAG: hypothetical protein ABI556_08065 [Gemmatimonadales bacterium]
MLKSPTKNPAGKVMSTVGGILGMAGVVAWLVGFKITLTPGMQELLFFKGLFAASFSLIALGAIIGRRINKEEKSREDRLLNESAPGFEEIREREEEDRTI